jgi:2-polyprenyl-3-methyl-5-hydroxy-6-metoxy-1,4-benzoquinol methylase
MSVGISENKALFENTNCPKCSSSEFTIVYKGKDYLHGSDFGDFFSVKCKSCGFCFLNPRPIPEILAKVYPSDYLPHDLVDQRINPADPINSLRYLKRYKGYGNAETIKKIKTSWKSLKLMDWFLFYPFLNWLHGALLVPKYVPDGKLMEIGCSSGKRLLSLKRMGWNNLHGIELVPEAVEKARLLGFKVDCGQVENTLGNYPDEYFDVIIASFVLEHLYNPFEVFNLIQKKLKFGGQFLFSTVVMDSVDARLYGKYWVGFDFPRHLVYFKKRDVMSVLKENNFHNIQSYYHPGSIDYKRSSSWKLENKEGTFLDKVILIMHRLYIMDVVLIFLSWLKCTSRVSFICEKK